MSSKTEIVRKNVIDIYLKNTELSYVDIGKAAGTSRATARNIVLKFLRDKSTARLAASRPTTGTRDKKGEKKGIANL